ncbi:MAG: hypothetical protein V4474_04045 [Patescibacteria group bacterium]
MKANFKTVQRFLYRDQDLAAEIGVEIVNVHHDLGEYADAIVNIPSNQRPTSRRIGAVLGLDHSAVVRFLKAHPELRSLHPRFDKLRRKPDTHDEEVEPPKVVRRWRDLGVAVWHENAGRYVGACASRQEYLDYWKKGLLKHQCEEQPKPEHLPTPEEVEGMT